MLQACDKNANIVKTIEVKWDDFFLGIPYHLLYSKIRKGKGILILYFFQRYWRWYNLLQSFKSSKLFKKWLIELITDSNNTASSYDMLVCGFIKDLYTEHLGFWPIKYVDLYKNYTLVFPRHFMTKFVLTSLLQVG